jgi:hypothetical protein
MARVTVESLSRTWRCPSSDGPMRGETIVAGLMRRLHQTDIDGQICTVDNGGPYVVSVLVKIREHASCLEV